MTERYFEKFQIIEYANTIVRNLTQRTAFFPSVYNNPLFYYPYDVKPGERPDTTSNNYYGDPYQAWLLYLSNQVIDPYYDWYMDQDVFDKFIVKKYGSYNNATSKTAFYRNNWYSDSTPTITSAAYNNLPAILKKFYGPREVEGVMGTAPIHYERKREDWTLKTNAIVRYGISSNNAFINDEIIRVRFSANQQGQGQVCFSNSTALMIQHTSGTAVGGTITANSVLVGDESRSNVVFTSAVSVANNIPAGESDFWSPVTYYDYETELNERNKSILVLKSEYAPRASKQLKQLLR